MSKETEAIPHAGEDGPGASDQAPSTWSALLRLGRVKFLLYSWLFYSFGTALALAQGLRLRPGPYAFGLFFAWCVHLMTHFCNEYYDFEADVAHPAPTRWTGGSRVLVKGWLPRSLALQLALCLLLVSLALALMLPEPVRPLAFLVIALGWFYTAPPFKLNYRSLGELAVSLGLIINGPLGGYMMQGGGLDHFPWQLVAPAFVVQFSRMLIMNLADYRGDKVVGKRTMVVRLGPPVAIRVHQLMHLLAYALVLALGALGLVTPPVVMAFACTAPLSVWQNLRLARWRDADPTTANSVAFWASVHAASMVVAPYVGVLLSLPIAQATAPMTILYALPPLVFFVVCCVQLRSLSGSSATEFDPQVYDV